MVMLVDADGTRFQVVEDDDPDNPLLVQADPLTVAAAQAGAPAAVQAQEPEVPAEGDEETVEGEPEPSSEDEASEEELEKVLDGFLAEHARELLKPELAGHDRTISRLAEQNRKSEEAIKALQAEVREAKIAGMTPEEQTRLREAWASEDRKSGLDEYAEKLDEFYLDLKRLALSTDYAEYGITAESLEGIADENEMEQFCKDKELSHWRAVAQGKAPAKATPAKPEPTVAKASAAAIRKAPAGASAQTDIGGAAPSAPTPKLDTGTGQEAMARSLNALPWQTVRVRN